MSTALQNYKVARGSFGQYRAGSVIPEWVVARAGSVEEQVKRGIVEPTHDAVNVSLKVPEPKFPATVEPPPGMVEEMNALREENERLVADNRTQAVTIAGLRKQLDARDKSLGQQTEAIEQLKAACEEHQEARDHLEKKLAEQAAEMEQLTAPAAA